MHGVKTLRDAVEQLKKEWLEGPYWDLAETEGFEAYRYELAEFQAMWQRRWLAEQAEKP
ncbi:MAG: hypothetical protein J5I92_15165 [Thiogranum sp.]|nr:hypothetical protein [Thiogranum sp.]